MQILIKSGLEPNSQMMTVVLVTLITRIEIYLYDFFVIKNGRRVIYKMLKIHHLNIGVYLAKVLQMFLLIQPPNNKTKTV